MRGTGPFELTKLSAQISVLMADRKDGSTNDAVRKSYQNLGTFRTAQNLVRHRGWMGLYSGFHLHLRKCHPTNNEKWCKCSHGAVRDTIGTGIYFITYESVKQLLANARGGSPTSPLAVVTAGGMCGLVSWACVRSKLDYAVTLEGR